MDNELTQILIVGVIAGIIMGSILAGKGFGKIGNLLVGVVGAIIGSYLTRFISINLGSFTLDFGQLVLALIGATIFILLLKFFSRKK